MNPIKENLNIPEGRFRFNLITLSRSPHAVTVFQPIIDPYRMPSNNFSVTPSGNWVLFTGPGLPPINRKDPFFL